MWTSALGYCAGSFVLAWLSWSSLLLRHIGSVLLLSLKFLALYAGISLNVVLGEVFVFRFDIGWNLQANIKLLRNLYPHSTQHDPQLCSSNSGL